MGQPVAEISSVGKQTAKVAAPDRCVRLRHPVQGEVRRHAGPVGLQEFLHQLVAGDRAVVDVGENFHRRRGAAHGEAQNGVGHGRAIMDGGTRRVGQGCQHGLFPGVLGYRPRTRALYRVLGTELRARRG